MRICWVLGCWREPTSVSILSNIFFYSRIQIFQLNHCNRCFAHVINLAVVAFMGRITKIAAVENANAIWEYDPNLLDNCLTGGTLDHIAALWTVIIKVR